MPYIYAQVFVSLITLNIFAQIELSLTHQSKIKVPVSTYSLSTNFYKTGVS